MILRDYLMISMSDLYNNINYNAALIQFNSSTIETRWSVFKNVHLSTTKGRCPICECRLDNSVTRASNNGVITLTATIDHYRPKDSTLYPFLKYNHNNYILMCSDCNNCYKGNLFPLHSSTPQRATSLNTLNTENPLITNPITDNLLDLFDISFTYTSSGKKVLDLIPKHKSGYLLDKANETIKVFSLGNTDTNRNINENVNNCRINLLNDHFKKFHPFIKAIESKDSKKAFIELQKYKLDNYGFYEFIKNKQYTNLI